MKKFLGILVIAGSLVACNNTAETKDNTKDSLDSVEKAQKDTVQSNASQAKDSIGNAIEAKKDSVDKMAKDTTHK